jgi:hypothetical protein
MIYQNKTKLWDTLSYREEILIKFGLTAYQVRSRND